MFSKNSKNLITHIKTMICHEVLCIYSLRITSYHKDQPVQIFSCLVAVSKTFFDPVDIPNQQIRSNGRGDIFFVSWLGIFYLPWLNHNNEHTNPFRFNLLHINYTLTCISFIVQQFQAYTEVLVKLIIANELISITIFN